MVASGWQGGVVPGGGRLSMTVPVAQNPGGKTDPLNTIIQDIQLVPKVGGLVQYSMDVTILIPNDLSRSNHVILFDVPNHGNRLLPGGFNIGGSITSAGDGFLR